MKNNISLSKTPPPLPHVYRRFSHRPFPLCHLLEVDVEIILEKQLRFLLAIGGAVSKFFQFRNGNGYKFESKFGFIV